MSGLRNDEMLLAPGDNIGAEPKKIACLIHAPALLVDSNAFSKTPLRRISAAMICAQWSLNHRWI
jgi:hypothetical protein